MNFTKKENKYDPVITWVSDDGFWKIIKRPGKDYELRNVSLFNIMGEVVGTFKTLKEAMNF